jgi:hypothetical protein
LIRRYYILPLRPDVEDRRVQEFLDVLRAADRFIPGLVDSSADLDLGSRTVVWENTFVDEASYSGPYMVHPFHIAAIDNYVMADSPECLTQDIYATRFQTDDATQPLRTGLRRVLLLNVESPDDAEVIRSMAATAGGMEASAFGADDVGWVSAKGRPWTHVWEQAFTDTAQLARYLATADGIARSSREGFSRLGVDLRSLQVFTCPFELKAPDQQTPPSGTPGPDLPVRYTLTARVDIDDADRFVLLLERLYDPVMAEAGSPLVERRRTVAHGYLQAEVESSWGLNALALYSDIRASTYADPAWNEFVREAMPLVCGGTRRFSTDRRADLRDQ